MDDIYDAFMKKADTNCNGFITSDELYDFYKAR